MAVNRLHSLDIGYLLRIAPGPVRHTVLRLADILTF